MLKPTADFNHSRRSSMHPKHPYFRALILAGLMSWMVLEVSTNLSGPTKRAANPSPLQTLPMTSGTVARNEAKAAHSPNSRIAGAYGQLPLSFEVNQGQTDPQVQFLSRGGGYALFLTKTEAVLQFRRADFGLRSPQLPMDDFRLSILDRILGGIQPPSLFNPHSAIRNPQLCA